MCRFLSGSCDARASPRRRGMIRRDGNGSALISGPWRSCSCNLTSACITCNIISCIVFAAEIGVFSLACPPTVRYDSSLNLLRLVSCFCLFFFCHEQIFLSAVLFLRCWRLLLEKARFPHAPIQRPSRARVSVCRTRFTGRAGQSILAMCSCSLFKIWYSPGGMQSGGGGGGGGQLRF